MFVESFDWEGVFGPSDQLEYQYLIVWGPRPLILERIAMVFIEPSHSRLTRPHLLPSFFFLSAYPQEEQSSSLKDKYIERIRWPTFIPLLLSSKVQLTADVCDVSAPRQEAILSNSSSGCFFFFFFILL